MREGKGERENDRLIVPHLKPLHWSVVEKRKLSMKVKLLIYWSSYIPTANNDYKLFSCVAGTVGPNCRTPRQQTNLERQLYCYLETLKEIQNTILRKGRNSEPGTRKRWKLWGKTWRTQGYKRESKGRLRQHAVYTAGKWIIQLRGTINKDHEPKTVELKHKTNQ